LTFWGEFESRFNFIAVDYLVYTYEVVKNINESYPIPILTAVILSITLAITYLFTRKRYFEESFSGSLPFGTRTAVTIATISMAAIYSLFISNSLPESGNNRYQQELSKAGIYSFFSAFKNNELNYDDFYKKVNQQEALEEVRKEPGDENAFFLNETGINRLVNNSGTITRPNVIMITIESLSADFMEHFGNKDQITPVLDSLWNESIVFTNLYATGTRTVRGMEALTLAVPPTPGSSIVRRPDNEHLATIGSIFRQQHYTTSFFYGGDGYFDNMNHFFGNNGYEIHDRGRTISRSEEFATSREIIPDSLVEFENAWGISDEDLYEAVLRDADNKYKKGELFYNFVMTTSNHRPYTYPAGRINIPSGSGRNGAVKYTDYAIGKLLLQASKKPWYYNTVFILVADHCASSAGKNEIDISKYHIPAIIFDPRNHSHKTIDKMCSQIDLYPTLFNMLHWNYKSTLFGKDVLSSSYHSRIYVGTYQKLGYLMDDTLAILSPLKKVDHYLYNPQTNTQAPVHASVQFDKKAIANYQTAYHLFKHGGFKL
jgi:phosphoglycerol transferase MdoB-like AlkP superfamily enzyme